MGSQPNTFGNRPQGNLIFLLALFGGVIFWLFLGVFRGDKLFDVLDDKNVKRNVIFFLVIAVIVVGIMFLSQFIGKTE